jgi:hypothetical protein
MNTELIEDPIECFLEQLIYENRENTISNSVKLAISDLYIKYRMEKQGSVIPMDDDEMMMKYITMGWFIYNNMERDNDSVMTSDMED